MDSAILSATSGLLGSLVGGLSTFAASWFTTRSQYRAQTLVQQAVGREALYAEFVAEAAGRLADAWSHEPLVPRLSPACGARRTDAPHIVTGGGHRGRGGGP